MVWHAPSRPQPFAQPGLSCVHLRGKEGDDKRNKNKTPQKITRTLPQNAHSHRATARRSTHTHDGRARHRRAGAFFFSSLSQSFFLLRRRRIGSRERSRTSQRPRSPRRAHRPWRSRHRRAGATRRSGSSKTRASSRRRPPRCRSPREAEEGEPGGGGGFKGGLIQGNLRGGGLQDFWVCRSKGLLDNFFFQS